MGKRPSKRRRKSKRKLKRQKLTAIGMAVFLLLILCVLGIRGCIDKSQADETPMVAQTVLAYEPAIEKYAKEYGLEDNVELLMAIMQVESGGEGNDVMQSSESLGLALNSLMPESSIEQACHVLSQLFDYADVLGCDENSVIQAYNFGITYLNFVAENGGSHSFELAQAFAQKMSDGETVDYVNPLSVERNGGWRYNYGNMFYVELVRQYCPE